MLRIGVDIGGTSISAALIDENYNIVERVNAPTHNATVPQDVIQLTQHLLRTWNVTADDIDFMGVAVPGAVSPNGQVLYACNIEMRDFNLEEALRGTLRIPMGFGNDANVAALGEVLAGAAVGCRDVVMLTVGTGVGGGILVDGQMLTGGNWAAGEVGHMVVDLDGPLCSCGRRGCFEQFASSSALVRMAREEGIITNDDFGAKEVFALADAGDEKAVELTDRWLRYLSVGCVNLVNLFQPQMLCIGGAVSQRGERLLGPIRELLKAEDYARNGTRCAQVSTAALGGDAGLIGAAFLDKIL